eukprot:CAMPEP_0117558334 /NCGR_PEP_ID=MMETSP0784-20121206/52780_1 /TAXON_ID=39447 /ORGANISM="" /LENGTH=42 /DNA_ID= /DNA_START= /DNA_END= /DNA_ORIENTATION=
MASEILIWTGVPTISVAPSEVQTDARDWNPSHTSLSEAVGTT